jgi:hypothetical protein
MQQRMEDLLEVCCDAIDPAGGASGHAGETSEMFRRGRAAYGSVAAFIVPFSLRAHPSWW